MNAQHILVIDDDARNADVLARLLKLEGINSTQVINPLELDEVIETLIQVDAVFLDLEMPGLNGYDVLAKFRADARFTAVPIVACTVHLDEFNVAYNEGFDGFISKPIDSDKFPQQLARILNGESVWESH